MSVAPVTHGGAVATDLHHGVRDSLREVADRFASARRRRAERRRVENRLPSVEDVTRVIGDSFALPTFARLI
ncbi:hypothetical protein [Demequina mangrovi]|uniref:Uncharacterized protein n=1 Tax=Demequina mangrovi TaxID=1043493 RepID=A0A1H7AYJ7_9MICO|nr:hypothetical protein [Demequina mangrovi]SEJ70691.1 hypothetical protein SAMN05421637_2751 [Demequina mangrovi]